MSARTVNAIGDLGRMERCPVDQAVPIEVAPVGDEDSAIVPATVRWLIPTLRPLRLIRAQRARRGKRHAFVTFECNPWQQYGGQDPAAWPTTYGCYVRHAADAADPLFAGLTDKERARIARATSARGAA